MKDEAEIQRIRLKRATRNLLELASFTQKASATAVIADAVKKPIAGPSVVASTAKTAAPVALNDESVGEQAGHAVKVTKPRAAVVAWDLSHNPAGRALVLYRLLEKDYEVDLIGPIWSRFGKSLWEPLRGQGLNVRQFSCKNLMDFVPKAEFVANAKTYDMVYVCKPRMPSMFPWQADQFEQRVSVDC